MTIKTIAAVPSDEHGDVRLSKLVRIALSLGYALEDLEVNWSYDEKDQAYITLQTDAELVVSDDDGWPIGKLMPDVITERRTGFYRPTFSLHMPTRDIGPILDTYESAQVEQQRRAERGERVDILYDVDVENHALTFTYVPALSTTQHVGTEPGPQPPPPAATVEPPTPRPPPSEAHEAEPEAEQPGRTSAWQCDKCASFYTEEWAVRWHIETHALEGTIQSKECPACTRSFETPGATRFHYVRFHGEHPVTTIYQCDQCPKMWDTQRAMSKHRSAAHPAQPEPAEATEEFPCPRCDRVCSTRQTLTTHLRSVHHSD